jgi:hypothetical protein
LFKEVFARELVDHGPGARRALASKLLDEAAKTGDVPSDQFVLFLGAAEASRDGEDLGTCIKATDALSAIYDVNGLQLKADFAEKISLHADTLEGTDRNCRAGLELVDQLTVAGEYAEAARLLEPLGALAAVNPPLSRQIQMRSREVNAIISAEPGVAPQLEKLRAAPLDPAANLATGQFYCFIVGDWARGLPMLALGADTTVSPLAKQDLAGPSEAEAQVALGDAWWDYAAKLGPVPKSRVMVHAGTWYAVAAQRLSGLAKERVLGRQKEIADLGGGSPQPVDLKTVKINGKVRWESGALFLAKGSSISTGITFRPPVTFQLRVMTDEKDFRIGFAADQIIFNWEDNKDQLRVDGGPANGKHKKGVGRLPARRWVNIDLVVNPDEIVLNVDKTEIYRVKANFSKVDQPLTLRAHNGEVAIKSITILPSDSK